MRFTTGKPDGTPKNRVIKKFAITPIKIKEEIRFLETVYIWQSVYRDSIGDGYHWENCFFSNKEQYDEKLEEEE